MKKYMKWLICMALIVGSFGWIVQDMQKAEQNQTVVSQAQYQQAKKNHECIFFLFE